MQHATFMLVERMLFNSYDNSTPIEPFFTWLSGDAITGNSHVI
jgi:hypothetical protein